MTALSGPCALVVASNIPSTSHGASKDARLSTGYGDAATQRAAAPALLSLDRFPKTGSGAAMTSAIQVNRVMPVARSHDLRAQPRIAAMSPESFSGFSLGA
jgi:hypothetical protein